MSNYCQKGHWENGMKLPCKQCEIESLQSRIAELESQLTNLRQRLYQLKGADSAIDSERQANHELTEQLAALRAENERLKEENNQLEDDCGYQMQWKREFNEQLEYCKGQLAKTEQRIAELEAENERLRDAVRQQESQVLREQATSLDIYQQLAASQLRETQLREALSLTQDGSEFAVYLPEAWSHAAAKDYAQMQEALTTPISTDALEKYVAEKVKDSESRTGNQSPCYTIARDMAVRMWEKHYKTDAPKWEPLDDFMGVLSQISNMLTGLGNVEELTRQRDLAVEALEKVGELMLCGKKDELPGRCSTASKLVIKAISTIKGSEK